MLDRGRPRNASNTSSHHRGRPRACPWASSSTVDVHDDVKRTVDTTVDVHEHIKGTVGSTVDDSPLPHTHSICILFLGRFPYARPYAPHVSIDSMGHTVVISDI